MAEGLFHRAIMQSGTAIQPFNYHGMDGPTLAKRLGRELDCPTSHGEYLVECLQRIDPKLFGPWMKLVNEFVREMVFVNICLKILNFIGNFFEVGSNFNVFVNFLNGLC